jgi:DNA-binding MarR family transcriptional regulator
VVALSEIERRTIRVQLLPEGLASDISWSILLDLFLADEREQDIDLADCGSRWGVSDTTAVRHIAALIEARLAVRGTDPDDQSLGSIRLTPGGREILSRILDHIVL